MNRNIIVAVFAIFMPYYLIGAEPSAFGAGDLSNPQPYGLTSSEQTLLENKQKLHKVVIKSNNQANEVESLRERIDGLQTIIESISEASRENKLKLKLIDKQNLDEIESSSEYEKRILKSIEDTNNLVTVNAKDIEKINLSLLEMSKLIDTINNAYVTKKEYNALVNDVNKFKDLVTKELKSSAKPKKSELDSMSNGDVATRAKNYYEKKLYTEALECYEHLIKKNYKPARSHYMAGEIKYNRKNYAEAIAYFKESAKLYSKASYMPTLLLHTAISMDNTGDKENAKTFYSAVISKYSDSQEAKEAKSKLDLLK